MSGKGDTPRPIHVDPETYASNWESTFGKKPEPAKDENGEPVPV